jgi:hypothetical protein
MRKSTNLLLIAGTLVLIIACIPSFDVQAELKCQSSERFGNDLIKEGDSERRVIEQGPNREVQVESPMGGAVGQRFDFYKQGRTIQIYTENGVVTRICRIRE